MLNYNTESTAWTDWSARVDHVFLADVYRYHLALPEFARRPLTSLAINTTHEILNLSYGNSFILVNFGLLFLCGLALYNLARLWRSSHFQALLSTSLFYLSFTVLLAFFSSIFTYDEPLQYLILFLGLFFATKQRWAWFTVFFFLGLWSRETTILLSPGIIFLFAQKEKFWSKIFMKRKFYPVAGWLILSTIIYVAGLYYFLSTKDLWQASSAYLVQTRFGHWKDNFLNSQFALESIVVIVLSVGGQFFVLKEYLKTKVCDQFDRRLATAVLMVFLINTPIALIGSKVREARILALPLIFLWPVLGRYLIVVAQGFWSQAKISWSKVVKSGWIVGGILSLIYLFGLAVGWFFSFLVYVPTASGDFDIGYQLYLALLLSVVFTYYFVGVLAQKIK